MDIKEFVDKCYKPTRMASIKDVPVQEIIEHYTQCYYDPHPFIAHLIENDDYTRSLQQILHDEETLVGNRSLDLERHQVNMYQKAFFMLRQMANQNPATALWLDEISGWTTIGFDNPDATFFQERLTMRSLVASGDYALPSRRRLY